MSDDSPRKTRLYGAMDQLAGPPTIADTTQFAIAEDPTAGTRVARYEVEDVLGRGGMGEVLSARDAQIGRLVAIKRLRVLESRAGWSTRPSSRCTSCGTSPAGARSS